jgi:hypothetical protein
MLGLEFALLDESRRVAAYDGPRLDVFEDGGTRTDYGTFTDGDAHVYVSLSSDPCFIGYHNGLQDQCMMHVRNIMPCRTNRSILRDDGTFAQRH